MNLAHKETIVGESTASLVTETTSWFRRISDAARSVGGEHNAAASMRWFHQLVFLRLCETRELAPDEELLSLSASPDLCSALQRKFRRVEPTYGSFFAHAPLAESPELMDALSEFLRWLYIPRTRHCYETVGSELLGQVYEQCLAVSGHTSTRKTEGIYYTPIRLADRLVEDTLGQLCQGMSLQELTSVRILDPACGSGVFLLRAYRRLLEIHLDRWMNETSERRRHSIHQSETGSWMLSSAERARILTSSIFGIDRDSQAVTIARASLILESLTGPAIHQRGEQLDLFVPRKIPRLDKNLRWGDALLEPTFVTLAGPSGHGDIQPPVQGVDWGSNDFDVVIGNPPWGQKQITASATTKQYLRQRFPSSRGIFDWFRPFVELGVRLVRPGGYFGMVLPDIVLLKNYEPTRKHLLNELALTKIEWWGMAFSAATIDAVTIAGRKEKDAPTHKVEIVLHESGQNRQHQVPQNNFRNNPRSTFNLFLTKEKRRIVDKIQTYPKLGDFFEVHEGIHSGNIRSELFVQERRDESCHEMYFGRDELRPYSLQWKGCYVRLAALPERRSRQRYANLGRKEWHESPKVLVRRTGDSVSAALDENQYYASNNFFLALPQGDHPLTLDGLCALLNSRFMTWYFRTIEPRQGRAFAELKIKHLIEFPLPSPTLVETCQQLNELGAKRRMLSFRTKDDKSDKRPSKIDEQIELAVHTIFGVPAEKVESNHAASTTPARDSEFVLW